MDARVDLPLPLVPHKRTMMQRRRSLSLQHQQHDRAAEVESYLAA
jgi:hypothetical protein